MLEAGSGVIDITPKNPVFLGGYGVGPLRRCTHLSAPIFARALLLRESLGQHGGSTGSVSFLVLDTQGLPYETTRKWFGFRAIEEELKNRVPDLQILFGASSHSHCCPDSTGLWGGLDDEYATQLIEGAIAAVDAASRDAKPCKVSFGVTNTRGLLRSQVRTAPHDRIEERIFVLEARSEAAIPIGRIVVFSAHPTVASGNHLTPDWPGELSSLLESDPGGTTLVIPGSLGRTQPKIRGDGSQRAVRQYARSLETQLRPLLENLHSVTDIGSPTVQTVQALSATGRARESEAVRRTLEWANDTVEHPITNIAMLAAAKALGRVTKRPGLSTALPVARTTSRVVRVGNVYFFGFPGEAYPNLQWELETQMSSIAPGSATVVCSMVADQIGYLIYPPSSYLGLAARSAWNDNALFCSAPALGQHLLEASLHFATQLAGTQVRAPLPREVGCDRRIPHAAAAVWDLLGFPASALATALTVCGAVGYAAAPLGIRVAQFAKKIASDLGNAGG